MPGIGYQTARGSSDAGSGVTETADPWPVVRLYGEWVSYARRLGTAVCVAAGVAGLEGDLGLTIG